jgi:phosphatidylglycerophosphatase A
MSTSRSVRAPAARDLGWYLATLAGVGLAPASGTVASAVVTAAWMAARPSPAAVWLVAAVLVVVGLWAAHHECRSTGIDDPSTVVIDEAAGMWLALAAVRPGAWQPALAAFALFRIFDIVKPPPIRQLERLPSGLGVMLDDVAAGLAAYAILRLWPLVSRLWNI